MQWSVSEALCLKMLLYVISTRILGVASRLRFAKKTHTLSMKVQYTGYSRSKLSEFKFSGSSFEKTL